MGKIRKEIRKSGRHKSGLWGSGVPGTGRVPGGFRVARQPTPLLKQIEPVKYRKVTKATKRAR